MSAIQQTVIKSNISKIKQNNPMEDQMTKPLCRICSAPVLEQFTSHLLNKYSVKYFQCPICGYVQTEKPFWLDAVVHVVGGTMV